MTNTLVNLVAAVVFAVVADAAEPTAFSAAGGNPFVRAGSPTAQNRIDELVLAKLARLDIQPAEACSDAVFVRRAYLDVIGTLPAAREAREFLLDRDPNKRSALIERLLQREEFADYWAMKWCDLLRVKSEFPINLWPNAVQAYHHWIRSCIRDNMPYDRFVRELLTASGSNFRVPQVNFYRAIRSRQPQEIAQAVALAFMGARAERWEKGRLSDMAVFFSHIAYKSTAEWKEEIVCFDPNIASGQAPGSAALAVVFPDGTALSLPAGKDPREVFADWLIEPNNPWFARCIVNRAWYWLLGRGIIHEPDDIRPDNPPGNPELLAWLEKQFIASNYDLKYLYRLILNSNTYQFSSIPRTDKPDAAANFAYYPLRPLEAEVLIDALNQVTGTTEKYSSPIPEPFTFIPENQRAIAIADGSITGPFLEMFGRPSRDTGLASERNTRPTAAQRLHLLNSSHIQNKIEQGPGIRSLIQSNRKPKELITSLYLTILSRFPTDEELRIVQAYTRSGPVKGREAVVDLAWALINSTEFLCRH